MSQAIRAKKFRTGGRFTKRSNAPKNFWKKIDSLLKSSILYHMKNETKEMTKEEQILAIERIFASLGYGKLFRPHISDEEAAKIAEEYNLTKH